MDVSGRFTLGERTPVTRFIGGWVGPRAFLKDLQKRKLLTLLGFELQSRVRLARSQSLYRLRYREYYHGVAIYFHIAYVDYIFKSLSLSSDSNVRYRMTYSVVALTTGKVSKVMALLLRRCRLIHLIEMQINLITQVSPFRFCFYPTFLFILQCFSELATNIL
jgi:hypothetical protein